jgi:hypothetical protein
MGISGRLSKVYHNFFHSLLHFLSGILRVNPVGGKS